MMKDIDTEETARKIAQLNKDFHIALSLTALAIVSFMIGWAWINVPMIYNPCTLAALTIMVYVTRKEDDKFWRWIFRGFGAIFLISMLLKAII